MSILAKIKSLYITIHNVFTSLNKIDQVLLLILCASLILKLVKDVVVIYLKKTKRFYQGKDQGKCYYLEKINDQNEMAGFTCCNFFHSRNFKKNKKKCPREKCRGYYPPGVAEKNSSVIENCLPINLLFTTVDWLVNLTTVISIVRTLLEVSKV